MIFVILYLYTTWRGCDCIESLFQYLSMWGNWSNSTENDTSRELSMWVTWQGKYRTWVRCKSYLTAKPRHLTTLWFWVDLDLWCVSSAHLFLSISYNGWRITFFCVALTLTHFFLSISIPISGRSKYFESVRQCLLDADVFHIASFALNALC